MTPHQPSARSKASKARSKVSKARSKACEPVRAWRSVRPPPQDAAARKALVQELHLLKTDLFMQAGRQRSSTGSAHSHLHSQTAARGGSRT